MRNFKTMYKRNVSSIVCVIILLIGLLCLPATLLAVESIKFATLAPKGSTWMNNFNAMAKEIQANTDGQIKFRFYANGIQGDELDVISKMRNGLIHAGAMTATGLGEINEEVLIFQLPRMFRSYEELDYVRQHLREDLYNVFLDKGYVLIGMGDIGFYHIFSNHPIRNIDDLKSPNVKMWMRTNDKIAQMFYKKADIATVPGEVTQVLPGLYAGRINAVTVSPYVTVALQWASKFKYMTDLPVNVGVGATIITKEKFDKLTPAHQKVILDAGDKYQTELMKNVRQDNKNSLDALVQKVGIEVVKFEEDSLEAWDTLATETHQALVGEIYSQEFLDKINKLLSEYREKK